MPPSKRPNPTQVGSGTPTTDPTILLKRRKERQRANEKLQLRLNEHGIKRVDIDENNLSFTSNIPTVLLINQKNYYTEYLKRDDNYQFNRKVKDKLSAANNNSNGSATTIPDDPNYGRTIVIHPGSHSIKIGWAEDVDPIIIPNLIGYIKKDYVKPPKKEKERDGAAANGAAANFVGDADESVSKLDPKRQYNEEMEGYVLRNNEKFESLRKPIIESYKERMKYYKRRILPNCHEGCFNFNKKQQSNYQIDEISEDFKGFIKASKWLDQSGRDYVLDEEIFRLNNENEWNIRSPFLFTSDCNTSNNGELGFNEQDTSYKSREEILGDIEKILRYVLKEKLGLQHRSQFNNLNVLLIVPSLYRKSYIESMIDLLLNRIEFGNGTFIQEGLCASFGLGLSTGCIVDIGNNNIHICCVDEGVVIEDSRITLDYGISDVVRLWGKMLINQQFPLYNINFQNIKDWELLENIFKDHVTFDDSKCGVIQVGKFSKIEKKKVRKFQFKCFDENILCCMALFYPEIFIEDDDAQDGRICLSGLSPNKKLNKGFFEGMSSKFTGYYNEDPISVLQDLQRTGVKINDMSIEESVGLLSELEELFESWSNIGSGRRGNSIDISNKMKMKRRKMAYANAANRELSKMELETRSMRKNMRALDAAIVESIAIGGLSGDGSRGAKLWGNICLVGGGANIEGFEGMLLDRLSIVRSEVLGSEKLADAVGVARVWRREARETKGEAKGEAKGDVKGEAGGNGGGVTGTKDKDKDKDKEKDKEDDSGGEEEDDDEEDLGDKFEMSDEQRAGVVALVGGGEDMRMDVQGAVAGEVDRGAVCWKGGGVYARLKVAEELWVSRAEWTVLGGRVLGSGGVVGY